MFVRGHEARESCSPLSLSCSCYPRCCPPAEFEARRPAPCVPHEIETVPSTCTAHSLSEDLRCQCEVGAGARHRLLPPPPPPPSLCCCWWWWYSRNLGHTCQRPACDRQRFLPPSNSMHLQDQTTRLNEWNRRKWIKHEVSMFFSHCHE